MTSPKHAKTTSAGRQYVNPVTGQTYPSVTTILGQIGKGEALKWWAAGEVAKYAVEMRDTWLQLDNQAAIDLLKREPLRSLNRAASRGTDVHAIADHYAKTGEIGDITAHNGYVDAMRAFFNDHQPMPVLTECTVFGEAGYAGSFDMVCRMPALDDKLVILDYKTSKAIYNDTAAQLAAYAHAEQYIDEHDVMHPMVPIEAGVVVRFGADGEYEVKEMNLDNGWSLFQAALAIYNATSQKLDVGAVRPVPTDYSALRTNLIERVLYIKNNHPEQMGWLMMNWIPALPPLSSDQPILRHQLLILDKLVTFAESQTSAPFNPAPALELPQPQTDATSTVAPSEPEMPVAEAEVEKLRTLVNTAPKEVKQAIKQTVSEASQAKTTLSLQGKPDLRRVVIADFMLDVYIADNTNEREYMRTLLRHHGHDHTNIGATLGRLSLSEISKLGETHAKVQTGTASVEYQANTDTFSITESKQK